PAPPVEPPVAPRQPLTAAAFVPAPPRDPEREPTPTPQPTEAPPPSRQPITPAAFMPAPPREVIHAGPPHAEKETSERAPEPPVPSFEWPRQPLTPAAFVPPPPADLPTVVLDPPPAPRQPLTPAAFVPPPREPEAPIRF